MRLLREKPLLEGKLLLRQEPLLKVKPLLRARLCRARVRSHRRLLSRLLRKLLKTPLLRLRLQRLAEIH